MHDKRETVKMSNTNITIKKYANKYFPNGISAYQKRRFSNAAQHLQRLANLSCFCAEVNTRRRAYVDLMAG